MIVEIEELAFMLCGYSWSILRRKNGYNFSTALAAGLYAKGEGDIAYR
jgi:hypothetical protein